MTNENELIKDFHSVSGVVLTHRPVNLSDIGKAQASIRLRYEKAGKPIEPPILKMPTAAGTQKKEMTEAIYQSLLKQIDLGKYEDEVLAAVEEAVAAWEDHGDALRDMNIEMHQIQNRIIFSGILEKLPEDEAWIRKREKMGIDDVPPIDEEGDDFDRFLYWLINEILILPSEFLRLQNEIILNSSDGAVTEEQLAAAGDSFRDFVNSFVEGSREGDSGED